MLFEYASNFLYHIILYTYIFAMEKATICTKNINKKIDKSDVNYFFMAIYSQVQVFVY